MAEMSLTDDEPPGDELPAREGSPVPRQTRRLPDKMLVVFHHACDLADLEVADALLRIIEMMLTRRPVQPGLGRRRDMETLVAAHERLWLLRYPKNED